MLGPVTRSPSTQWRTNHPNGLNFGLAVDRARQQPPVQPVKEQAPTDPVDAAAGALPAPFQPGAKPLGVAEFPVEQGWPFRIYIQKAGLPPCDNDALHAQLPATPKLDPLPFGNRPAAAPDADRTLQADDIVTVLDETRLDYLGQQRQLLAKASDARLSPYERQQAKDDLAAVIGQEIDYAATEQSAPDFDALAKPIAARAPDDPVFREAIQAAKTQKQNEWTVDDRTAEGAAAVQQLGADGKYDEVTALVKQRLIAQADATGKDNPTPQALVASMTHLAGVYRTYGGGDTKQYLAAVQRGFSEAHKEVFLDRPIREIEAAWGKGGRDGAKAAAAKIAELTDPTRTMPILGGQAMNDPRVAAILRGCVDQVAQWGTGPSITDARKVVTDLAQASQNAVYADGDTPGQGKQAVDALGEYMVEKMRGDLAAKHLSPLHMMNLPELLADAGAEGNVTLTLAMTVRLNELAGQQKEPKLDGTDPGPMRDALLWASTKGLENFQGTVKAHQEKTLKDGESIGVPLQTWGTTLSPEEQAATIQKLLKNNPDLAATLEKDGQRTNWLNERSDSITRALSLYDGELKGIDGYENGQVKNYTVPGPMLPPTDAKTLLAAAPREPKHTNATWFERSNRLLLTFALQEQVKRSMSPDDYTKLMAGQADQLSPSGQRLLKTSNAIGRTSAGLSSYLFARNAAECLSGAVNSTAFVDKLVDAVYVPVHGAMAMSAAANATISPGMRERIFGIDPASGRPNTPFNKAYNHAVGRIDSMAAGATAKTILKGIAGAVLRDLGDAYYVFADTVNVFGYMGKPNTGWVHSVGYAFSVAGDLAFLSAPGFQIIGAETTAAAAAGGAGSRGLLGFLASRGVAFWTGVGAALMVIASGINYFASMADKAHEFDGADADFLKAMGVNGPVADKLGLHTMAQSSDQGSAGPTLMAAFWNLGYTSKDMVEVMNSWTPEQADKVATYIKYYDRHPAESVTQAVLDWMPKNGIPLPRYRTEDVGRLSSLGVKEEVASQLGATTWATPDPKRITAGQMLDQAFTYLGYTQEQRVQVMNSWSGEEARQVADLAKSYRTDAATKPDALFLDFAKSHGLALPQYNSPDARRLADLGVRKDIAGLIATGVTNPVADGDANPVTALTATFTKLGYSQQDMVSVINSWSPEQAGAVADSLLEIASEAKAGQIPKDIPGELVKWLQSRSVTLRPYDEANVKYLTGAGVKREVALLVARDPANTPKQPAGSEPAILKALQSLGNSREQAIAVMNGWTPAQANRVATLLDQTSINAPEQDIPKQQLLDLEEHSGVPMHPKK